MTCTIVAQVCDRLGHAGWYSTRLDGSKHLERVEAHPAHTFGDSQPGRIGVTLEHDGHLIGQVHYLEHGLDHNTDLRAVAVLDDLEADQVDGLMCSAEISARMRRGGTFAESCVLDGLALVAETAGVGARPIAATAGDYRDRRSHTWNTPKILERAARDTPPENRWTRPKALTIHRPTKFEERTAARLEPLEQRGYDDMAYVRPEPRVAYAGMGPIEYSRPYAGIIRVY